MALRFGCENLGAATVIEGLTTLLVSASTNPVPDLVALAATQSQDGVLRTEVGGAGSFSVASINLGAGSTLQVSATGTNPNVPLSVSLCPTDATTGACLQAAAPVLDVSVAAGATPTFSVFVQIGEITAFNPAETRLQVQFTDPSGEVRGATSVALLRSQ